MRSRGQRADGLWALTLLALADCGIGKFSAADGGHSTSLDGQPLWICRGDACHSRPDGAADGDPSVANEAGTPFDLGLDGRPADASDLAPDASGPVPADQGPDSPPPATTCRITITPAQGDQNTTFRWTTASNGNRCRWRIGSAALEQVNCNATGTWQPRELPAGRHTLTLVADGPAGQKTCQASYERSEPTTCSITISPRAGDHTTRFTWRTQSNATSCQWRFGTARAQDVDCNATGSWQPAQLSAGTHTLYLVANGPGGQKTCSARYTRSEPTTCSVDVSPRTGDHAQSFTWRTQSNATSCKWRIDSGPLTSVDCNATGTWSPNQVVFGDHTLTLSADGPGGQKQCSVSYSRTQPPALTCSLRVTPSPASHSQNFTWRTESNGTQCRLKLNSGASKVVGCNSSGTWSPSAAGVGNHTARLDVTGAAGSKNCSTSFRRNPEPTDCRITISPRSGDQTTRFSWSVASRNGSNCSWRLGSISSPIDCNKSGSWQPGQAQTGTHTVYFTVGNGPSGPKTCSATYTRKDTDVFDPNQCSFKPNFVSWCEAADISAGTFMLNNRDLFYSNGRTWCYFACWEDSNNPSAPCYVNRTGTTSLPSRNYSCVPRSMGCGDVCR